MILHCIHRLLNDEVIENTFRVMCDLHCALQRQRTENLSTQERKALKDSLLDLCSESIREALHKHELRLTNSIIREKNRLVVELGEDIPETHQEIDPKKYSHNW